jgi:hypothetical protein
VPNIVSLSQLQDNANCGRMSMAMSVTVDVSEPDSGGEDFLDLSTPLGQQVFLYSRMV